MQKSKKLQAIMSIALCCLLAVSVVFAAEDRPQRRGPGEGGPGQREGRRGFDREGMQQRMMEMMKERLGATDEEWQVIQPRLSEVMELSQSTQAGGMGMFGMFGRRGRDRGNDQSDASANPVQAAASSLQETLDKEAPSSTEIQNKLLALRGAREQAKQKLAAAQQKLREVLSVKQEAQLVLMGMLD